MALSYCIFFLCGFLSLFGGFEAFSCLDGRCSSLEDGLIVCTSVVDQSILDISYGMRKTYEHIVVSKDMDCENVNKLEKRTSFKVINKDCNGLGYSSPLRSSSNSASIPHYVYETITCILAIISLLLSAKLRHNMEPVVSRLPVTYRSNKTFIRNLFKVCYIYFYRYILYDDINKLLIFIMIIFIF